ncbi:MAG: RAD55 family ATPase [Candidatus Thermoplasmatota archaeon]|nr:RAD55 family ATPase [Candidatus Thermoplasmatota archaeon]
MGAQRRVYTGIAGLDAQLGGGVPPGTSILLVAESSNALYQFLDEVAGFGIDQGEQVVWFELDRPWGLIQAPFERAATEGQGTFRVLQGYEPRVGSYSPNGSGLDYHEIGPSDVPSMAAKILSEVEPNRYRLVVSSLTTLLQSVSFQEVQGMLRQLVALNQSLGGLQIFTVVGGAHPPAEISMLKHMCTGVFELGIERKGFGLYSYLKVEKLLGVPDAARLLLFNETENGLRLESTRRVF